MPKIEPILFERASDRSRAVCFFDFDVLTWLSNQYLTSRPTGQNRWHICPGNMRVENDSSKKLAAESYLFGNFHFDEIFILFRSHGIDRVRWFEHIDEKFIGQHVQFLLIIAGRVRWSSETISRRTEPVCRGCVSMIASSHLQLGDTCFSYSRSTSFDCG